MAILRKVAACTALAFVGACSSGGSPAADAGDADDAKIGQGRLLVAENLASFAPALPPRADALALAQSIEARAVREGGGARATELHALAARIVERVWRVEGREQDAREAIDLFAASARATALSAGRGWRATSRATPRSRSPSCTAPSDGSPRRRRAEPVAPTSARRTWRNRWRRSMRSVRRRACSRRSIKGSPAKGR